MTKPKTRKGTTADRPWYREVTTGYVVWWDGDYLVLFCDGTRAPVREWDGDKKAATKVPRATAFAVARWLRNDFAPTKAVRVLRRYKVIP
jgi:hypothetical protein